MPNFYELSEDPKLKSELISILSKLSEIVSQKNKIKKLSEHPINEWYEWFSAEVYSDMITPIALLMNERESSELLNDFMSFKKTNVTELILDYKSHSTRISQDYVNEALRQDYLASTKSTVKQLHKDEVALIKILRSIK